MNTTGFSYLLGLSILMAGPGTIIAQTPQAPTSRPPTLDFPFPAGMQRGSSLDLHLTGSNLKDPVSLWTSFPAKVSFPTDQNNGKEPGKLRVHLEVPADAPIGTHALRLVTAGGISNLRIFCIDSVPQVLKEPKHRTSQTAQEIPVPCVVCGRMEADGSDWYRIKVNPGQHLSLDLMGRRLGSGLDPEIILRDVKTQKELPGGYSNDAPGQQTDPQLGRTFKEAGEILIEVRDVIHRGGPDFCYRLRIGDFPLVTTPLPLAVKRGSKTTIRFAGQDGEQVNPVEIQAPSDPLEPAIWVTPQGKNGMAGWPVPLLLSDLEEGLEKEPNDDAMHANRIPVPGAITGRFEKKGDPDTFVFSGKKGQRLLIQADSHDLLSPTEVYMVLRDRMGKQLQASNPMNTPRIDFTPSEDGDYSLMVEHLHLWGGPAESYRISVVLHQPQFELTVTPDRFDIAPGTSRTIPITVTRQDYAGPIEVRVVGKGLTGQITIPQGQNAGQLAIVAEESLTRGGYLLGIEGRAKIGERDFRTLASIRAPLSQGLAGLPVPPRPWYHQLALGVIERPLLTLSGKFDLPSVMRGKPIQLTLNANRVTGVTGEITLELTDLPAEVTAPPAKLPEGQAMGTFKLQVGEKARPGSYTIKIQGKTRFKDRDLTATTSVPLVIQ